MELWDIGVNFVISGIDKFALFLSGHTELGDVEQCSAPLGALSGISILKLYIYI